MDQLLSRQISPAAEFNNNNNNNNNNVSSTGSSLLNLFQHRKNIDNINDTTINPNNLNNNDIKSYRKKSYKNNNNNNNTNTNKDDNNKDKISKEDELNMAYNNGKLGLIDGKPISNETKRRCEMADLFFLEYYCNHLNYVNKRKERSDEFKSRPIIPTQSQAEQLCKIEISIPNSLNDQGLPQTKIISQVSYSSIEEKEKGWKSFIQDETNKLRQWRARVGIANFTIIRQVGQGGFGQVFLAKKNDTKELVALKKMSKRVLKAMGEVQHILTERDILTRTRSDWLVRLFYAFQDQQNVYLAMEYVPGGDMRTLLNNSGCLREPHAKFYISEMIMSVSILHDLGFIHRDLKPENFLIDKYGHLKLTDFGLSRGKLSKEIINHLKIKLEKIKLSTPMTYSTIERRSIRRSLKREDLIAHSLVGSPDYMAPEILTASEGTGYDASIDFWALGCIMYELLCGYPPFSASTTDEIWVNVYHWRKVLERPIYEGIDEEFNISNEAWEAITKFIADKKDRYTTISLVQNLDFFKDIEFSNLRLNSNFIPPFIPTLSSETDTSHFDDFNDPKDIQMYKEVQDRISQLQLNNNNENNNINSNNNEDNNNYNNNNNNNNNRNNNELNNTNSLKLNTKSAEENLRGLFVGFTFKHKH